MRRPGIAPQRTIATVLAVSLLLAGCAPEPPPDPAPAPTPDELPLIRVLAIDGGGARGVIPAAFLDRIERLAGAQQGVERVPIHELFDVIAGTSTGSLIAAMLTVPKAGSDQIASAAEIVDFYMNSGGEAFFARTPEYAEKAAQGQIPRYPAQSQIDGILAAISDQTMLSQAATNVAFTVYNLSPDPPRTYTFTRWRARYGDDLGAVSDQELANELTQYGNDFSGLTPVQEKRLEAAHGGDFRNSLAPRELLATPCGDHEFPMWQVVRAASTYPGIWPGWTLESESGEDYYPLDGGMYAINPVLEGLAHAIRLLTVRNLNEDYRFLVVSLGTGFYDFELDPAETSEWGPAQWFMKAPLPPVIPVLFEGQTDLADTLMQKISGLNNRVRDYYRFQPEMEEDFQLDQVDPETMKTLLGYAEKMLAGRSEDFERIAATLVSSRRLPPEPPWVGNCLDY